MPKKRGSKTSKTSKTSRTSKTSKKTSNASKASKAPKKTSKLSKTSKSSMVAKNKPKSNDRKKKSHENDNEDIYNSEEDYVPESEESEISEEHTSQSGGETENELGDDSATLDIDPDDEQDIDSNEDDKYDPVNEMEETEDPNEESDIAEETAENEAVDENENEDEAGSEVEKDMGEDDKEFTADAKKCHLKNLNKDFIVLDEDDSHMYGKMEYKKITDENRECDAIMTYYEMVRIIGTRAQQFNFGAEPLVKGIEGLHPAKMAYLELISKMTPFIIRRHLPGKKYEDWRLDELEIIHSIDDDFFVPEKFNWDALFKEAEYLKSRKHTDTNEVNARVNRHEPKKSNLRKSSGSKTSNPKKSGSKKSGSKKLNSKSNSKK